MIQKSVELAPQIPPTAAVVDGAGLTLVKVPPVLCSTLPPSPPTQMSLALVAQTARRFGVGLVAIGVQLLPSHCTTVPLSPTAQMRDADSP